MFWSMGTLLAYFCYMLTKYYIEIDGIKAEVPKGCLKNWDEIKCVYKRTDFSGVTRSFTTQFEFVGEMYDRLMALYLRDGVNARAAISLYTITNEWRWEEQFTCDLDFSSIEWDNYIVKMNCIDDSLAALISANKGTKYEAVVGSELKSDYRFVFNRLPIKNSITYGYSGGDTDEEDGSLTIDTPVNTRVYMGILNDEDVFVNKLISWNEDQSNDADSYMIEAHGDVDIELDIDIDSDRCYPYKNAPEPGEKESVKLQYYTQCNILVYRTDGTSYVKDFLDFGPDDLRFCGRFASPEALKAKYSISSMPGDYSIFNYWAVVNGIVWKVINQGHAPNAYWDSTGLTEAVFIHKHTQLHLTLNLKTGEKVAVETKGQRAKLYSNKFVFSWMAKGDPVSLPAFSPETICQYLLNKMCAGRINAVCKISDYDARLKNTAIMAAESVRGIPKAKIYTSFSDFVNWMETVFGYTYHLSENKENRFKAHKYALGGFTSEPQPLTQESWLDNNSELPTEEDIIYFSCYGKFAAHDGEKWYINFPGASGYNDATTGYARTDTIFTIRMQIDNEEVDYDFFFISNGDGTINFTPAIYTLNGDDCTKPLYHVTFVHRSELFDANAPVRKIRNIRDVKYSVDFNQLFSSINIGYGKKEYQSINGRDEFNFNNSYSTDSSVCNKKLTMKSPYRADCYGLEFAAQKRGEDTTDTSSDSDVFFVYCKKTESGDFTPDTTVLIENALSGQVFNGAFSPMSCVAANEGLLCRQSNPLKLKFASSDGNSKIIIDGQAMSSDLTLSRPLMTCGLLEFSSCEVDDALDFNDIIEVHTNGITYRGFIKEVSFKYAKAETVKYKLIVKEIEL